MGKRDASRPGFELASPQDIQIPVVWTMQLKRLPLSGITTHAG